MYYECTWCGEAVHPKEKKMVARNPNAPYLLYHKRCYSLYLATLRELSFPEPLETHRNSSVWTGLQHKKRGPRASGDN